MRCVVQNRARQIKSKPSAREREMYRLRVVEGLSLREIGERFGLAGEQVRQLLSLHFGARGSPPADDDRRALLALGDACRELREQQGLSKAQVAAAARIAEDHLTALETGQLDADLDLLLAFARSIGVQLSTIVARADELERRAST